VLPPHVQSIQVNDGSAQRSEVRSIQVTFSDPVSFAGGDANAAAAFQLTHVQDSNNVIVGAAVSTDALGRTVVTLTFSGPETDPMSALNPLNQNPAPLPSLADGRYQLTVLSANVTGANGLALDGDDNGTAGGNYASPAEASYSPTGLHLYRLFGDATGDGTVDLNDLTALRNAFNSNLGDANYLAALDANNDGHVDLTDLTEFRNRFNATVY
jgi:hypothetical protein